MTSETEMYLAKAQECLGSARADLEAGRYNSVANRAYYAAFQAAVALLVAFDIRPKRNSWEHKFVHGQLSGKLIMRRKEIPAKFRPTLAWLLDTRIVADYRPQQVKRSDAQRAVREASEFAVEITTRLRERKL